MMTISFATYQEKLNGCHFKCDSRTYRRSVYPLADSNCTPAIVILPATLAVKHDSKFLKEREENLLDALLKACFQSPSAFYSYLTHIYVNCNFGIFPCLWCLKRYDLNLLHVSQQNSLMRKTFFFFLSFLWKRWSFDDRVTWFSKSVNLMALRAQFNTTSKDMFYTHFSTYLVDPSCHNYKMQCSNNKESQAIILYFILFYILFL